MKSLLGALAGAAFAVASVTASAQPQSPALANVRVLAFDGGWNLPIWVAQRNGFFEAQGLKIDLAYTPTSGFLVQSVLSGKADLAFATIDNVVAYQEGQGEAKVPDNPDLFAFMGGDGGFFSLVASPAVAGVPDLKGKTVSVDAMTNGFSFASSSCCAAGRFAGSSSHCTESR